jgi:hypothetical protein
VMLCPVSSAFSTLWPRTPTSVQLDGRADLRHAGHGDMARQFADHSYGPIADSENGVEKFDSVRGQLRNDVCIRSSMTLPRHGSGNSAIKANTCSFEVRLAQHRSTSSRSREERGSARQTGRGLLHCIDFCQRSREPASGREQRRKRCSAILMRASATMVAKDLRHLPAERNDTLVVSRSSVPLSTALSIQRKFAARPLLFPVAIPEQALV